MANLAINTITIEHNNSVEYIDVPFNDALFRDKSNQAHSSTNEIITRQGDNSLAFYLHAQLNRKSICPTSRRLQVRVLQGAPKERKNIMIKIIREQDCIYRETYILDLDDDYVAYVSNFFHYTTKERYLGQIEITAELLAKAFENKLTAEENVEIKVHGRVCRLQDYLVDFVDDDVWSCEYEREYIDSYDGCIDRVEYQNAIAGIVCGL